MRSVTILAVALVAVSGPAEADTFRFPLEARKGTWQVDIAWQVVMHPDCAGRWSIIHPAAFRFDRASNTGGNLRGNPGRGTYDVALKTEDCPSGDSDYVDPGRIRWHKVVVD
jgi:hypothetical protein